ncbi:MAG: hypothetical protein JW984_08350 [Deltaproteobacteria bacterium]|uniref:Uncharacterized protein n=1 Tax=Candidatus Zymogenus saltonus TaxID=2844893 RepID=A0A9D8KED2_9DELT|nr:hypothetical protein [Candidatus Zymogenus saltonus]
MSSKKDEKPISITIISIFFIPTAFLIFVHALINFNLRPIAEIFEIMRAMELTVPTFLIILFSLNRLVVIISSLEIALVLFIVLSAIQFLKLKNWARIALTVIALIETALLLCHLGFWALMITLLPDVTATLLEARSPEVLIKLFPFYACAIFLLLILPLIASIVFLRTEKIRSAML